MIRDAQRRLKRRDSFERYLQQAFAIDNWYELFRERLSADWPQAGSRTAAQYYGLD
jgi:hypothetical protein